MDPTMPQPGAAQQQMTGMDPNQAMQNQMLLQALNQGAAGGGMANPAPPAMNPQNSMPPPMPAPMGMGAGGPPVSMPTPPVDPSAMAGGLGSQNQMQGAGMQPGMSQAMMSALMSPVPGGQ